jgi:hypothetical protein
MAIPTKDSDLVSFGTNFSDRITATPATFHLLAADATQYSTLLAAYVAAYTANRSAQESKNRSSSLAAAKDSAKNSFLPYARSLYSRVQADPAVLDSDKLLLGITVRALPVQNPVPVVSPAVDIVSVTGRTVKIRVHDAEGEGKRFKPPLVKGAAVCTHIGPTAPTDPSAYTWQGNTTRSIVDIPFADDLAPGTVVWITAMYFNERQQNGPACTPVSATLQFGMSSEVA